MALQDIITKTLNTSTHVLLDLNTIKEIKVEYLNTLEGFEGTTPPMVRGAIRNLKVDIALLDTAIANL